MGFDWFKGFGPVPAIPIVNYLPTWHNRHIASSHGTEVKVDGAITGKEVG
ncbi:unnamed protein product [marine sediment metagenome]|uniref:Uncharacterized protein n=1 Tax=marine sediment metagenome TaxID=412755 RepID=X1RBY2_9ZZZZ